MRISFKETWIVVLLVLLLAAASLVPLLDPSEARYATIAQRMVLSGKWLVPEIDRGDGFIPFWGKPPLHLWATAISMSAFGFSEFAARLPSFLSLCGVIALGILFARRCLSPGASRIFPFLLLASPVPIAICLTCLLDVSFFFWFTLALVSFALTVQGQSGRHWSYLFFLALGAGFLTKGPLILALSGFVVFSWLVLERRWRELAKFPWPGGVALFLLMVAPWYFYAERSSPGLLKYFFVNENYSRYFSAQYIDLYGTAHRTFHGIIALYFLLGTLPTLPFLLIASVRRDASPNLMPPRPWFSFLFLWAISSVLFFLPSNNVLITYILPGIPGVLLLFSEELARIRATPASQRRLIARNWEPALATAITVLLFVVGVTPWLGNALSAKTLVLSFDDEDRESSMAFLDKLPYSALFYLQADPASRDHLPVRTSINSKIDGDVIVTRKELKELPDSYRDNFHVEEQTSNYVVLAPKQK